MAAAIYADEETLNSIIKKSSIAIGAKKNIEIIKEAQVVNVSNTITTLQNAFNKIYTHALNVKNIHKIEENRLQNIKKEVTMETKITSQSLAGGQAFDIGNLPNLFRQLTESVEDLRENLDRLDISSGDDDSDIGIGDLDGRRRRGRGRGRLGRAARGVRAGLGRGLTALGGVRGAASLAGLRYLAARGLDAGLGYFGVGQGLDENQLRAQDEENWARSTTLERIQSSIPRGVERIGGLLGFSSITAQARANRIRSEREYFERTRPNPAARLSGPVAGSMSFSSRFADYIRQSISNMTLWAAQTSPILAGIASAANYMTGGYVGGHTAAAGDSMGAGPMGPNTGHRIDSRYVNYLTARGIPPHIAQGVAAGIAAETGNNDPNIRGGYRNRALGLGQWLGSRRAEIIRRYGPNPSWQQQLDFLIWELRGGDPGGRAVLSASSASEALNRYIINFMRPGGATNDPNHPDTIADLRRGRSALSNAGLLAPVGQTGAISQGGNLVAPVIGATRTGGTGVLTSGMRWRGPGYYHPAADVGVAGNVPGTPIYAVDGGRVVYAGEGRLGTGFGNYGNVVAITHSRGQLAGLTTVYAHLESINRNVRVGSDIGGGALLGGMGSTGYSTGTHLHFEIRRQWNRRARSPAEAENAVAWYNANRWIVGGQSSQAGQRLSQSSRLADRSAARAINQRPRVNQQPGTRPSRRAIAATSSRGGSGSPAYGSWAWVQYR